MEASKDGQPPPTIPSMMPEEFRKSLAALNGTQEAFGALIGRGRRTVSRWANGKGDIPLEIAAMLRLMVRHRVRPWD